ncbi:MAG: signal peptidase II [Candidatus Dadabacteria bacterium]|nr:MAG: signal peptidase II [Candidatus Dadabacteria bacterium]
MHKYRTAAIITVLVVVIDQISKWLVVRDVPLYGKINLLPFLDVTHIRNPGAAFGIFRDLPESLRLPMFVLVLIAAAVVIVYFLSKTGNNDRLLVVSLSLILGGAIGNSIDRFRLRYVTDFIDFHWFGNPALHWPPFNLSDSAITIGVILILFDTFILKRGR